MATAGTGRIGAAWNAFERTQLNWRHQLAGMRVFRISFGAAIAFFLCVGLLAVNPALFAQTASQTQTTNPNLPNSPSLQNDALAGVRYDYRWELYGGFAYSHFDAGPNLLQGANLGGFDIQAARFFRRHWALAANGRGYYGTTGVVPNNFGIQGPFVSEHMFVAGPEYRGPSNEHGSMTLHALFGGAYGNFDSALSGHTPASVGLFNNQFTFASAIGGSIDLNRSPRLAFRVSPDALLTDYGSAGIKEQFAISVGLVYRLDQVGHRKKK
jgi:hypothetical protein